MKKFVSRHNPYRRIRSGGNIDRYDPKQKNFDLESELQRVNILYDKRQKALQTPDWHKQKYGF